MLNDNSDEFAAEGLHPKGTYWRCRPHAVIQPARFDVTKLPVKVANLPEERVSQGAFDPKTW